MLEGKEPVQPVPPPVTEAEAQRYLVEGLHLDEELIDDAAGSLGDSRRLHASAVHAGGTGDTTPLDADGVDLFDESDRPTLATRRAAQSAEERFDAPPRHSVPHRLERRGRHVEEGTPRLLGKGFGDMGLAGAWRAFEQHSTARAATHLLLKPFVVEKHVEGALHLVDHRAETLHIAEPHFDLLGQIHLMRRAGVSHHGDDEDGAEEQHNEDSRQPDGEVGTDAGPAELHRVTAKNAPPHPGADDAEDRGKPSQASATLPFAGGGDINAHVGDLPGAS